MYYWEREKKGADAEVDFVMEVGNQVIPIEVKAGPKGRLRSLQQFILEKNTKIAVRISQAPLALEKSILSVPFYMIHELARLIEQ